MLVIKKKKKEVIVLSGNVLVNIYSLTLEVLWTNTMFVPFYFFHRTITQFPYLHIDGTNSGIYLIRLAMLFFKVGCQRSSWLDGEELIKIPNLWFCLINYLRKENVLLLACGRLLLSQCPVSWRQDREVSVSLVHWMPTSFVLCESLHTNFWWILPIHSVVLFPVAVTFFITWWFIQFVDGFFSPIYERLGIDIFGTSLLALQDFISHFACCSNLWCIDHVGSCDVSGKLLASSWAVSAIKLV